MNDYLEFAKNLALEAGQIMKENFFAGVEKEWKIDHSPVTATDVAINRLVIERVSEKYPDHNVQGEEESSIKNDSEFLWVCDPLDGTIPFAHGIPISTFSLALVKNGESQVGVVYDPFSDRLYFAEKGKSAFLNNKPINVSDQDTLYQSAINIENFDIAKYDFSETEKALRKKHVMLLTLCSFIYPSSLVAKGEFIATIFPHHTAHDLAAVSLIVEEAGGKVSDIFGKPQKYDRPIDGAIVSNGKVHDELVEILKATATKNPNYQ